MLREAVNLFDDTGPAVDNDRRHRQLAQFSEKQDEALEKLDSRYDSCKENVHALLYLYAIDNTDEFRSR